MVAMGSGLLIGYYFAAGLWAGSTDDFAMSYHSYTDPGGGTNVVYTDGIRWYTGVFGVGTLTSDNGTAWTLHSTAGPWAFPPVRRIGGAFYALGRSAVLSGNSDQVLKSIDGITWTLIWAQSGFNGVDVAGDGTGRLIVAGNNISSLTPEIYRMNDDGSSPVLVTLPYGPNQPIRRVVYDPAHTSFVMSGSFIDPSTFAFLGGIVRSTDGGTTWILNTVAFGDFNGDLQYWVDENRLYLSGVPLDPTTDPASMTRSSDGGVTWTEMPTPFDSTPTSYPADGSGAWKMAQGLGTVAGITGPILVLNGVLRADGPRPTVDFLAAARSYAKRAGDDTWYPIVAGPPLDVVSWDPILGGPFPHPNLPFQRTYPRDDGRGVNAGHIFPPPTSQQGSTRRGPNGSYT